MWEVRCASFNHTYYLSEDLGMKLRLAHTWSNKARGAFCNICNVPNPITVQEDWEQ